MEAGPRLMWWLLRRLLMVVVVVVLCIIGLLLPVGYVEFACNGDRAEQPYTAILPPEHHRAEARTLLTYPEWHIVHAYDDYGQVISQDDPHDFGYFKAISTYWFSLCALKKRSAAHGGIDYETKQLVYVIGVSFSAELLLKAAYEETVGRVATWVRGPEHSLIDKMSAESAQAYAAFLQQTPWYKWDFARDVELLNLAPARGFRDRERVFALGTEFAAKSAYAGVIANAVANVGADELTLRMVVTGPDVDQLDQIAGVTIIGQRPEGVEIETTRYRALTELLTRMARFNLVIVEMAGNDDILFTATSDAAQHPSALFSFARQGYGDHRHLFMVKTKNLLAVLRDYDASALKVEHVHDY